MTNPSAPTPSTPSPTTSPTPSGGGGRYVVKTPWHCDAFHIGEIVVTPKGVVNQEGEPVTLSEKDAQELQKAAEPYRLALTVEKEGDK